MLTSYNFCNSSQILQLENSTIFVIWFGRDNESQVDSMASIVWLELKAPQ
jgi:hypothetical protein